MAAAAATAAGGLGTLSWALGRTGPTSRGYEEVARWKLAGGEGRIIALDHQATMPDLRALGLRLREESRDVAAAVIMVFDDVEAAREVRRGSRVIGEQRFEAALLHQRAMYLKEPARGEERLTMYKRHPEVLEVVRY
jgi:hypothetical protein